MPSEPSARALLLAPEAPYPLSGGGALRTASLLHYLAARYAVDLIVFRQPGAPDPSADLPPGLVGRLTVIDLPFHGRSLGRRVWRNATRVALELPPLVDRFSGFARQVGEAVAGRRYEVGVIEHSWCAPYLAAIAPACGRTVLDLHNVESVLHARCSETEPAGAAFAHRVFRRASLDLERQWLPRFSEVLATSLADAATVRDIAPSAVVGIYPNAIPWRPAPPPAIGDANVVVFSGNMEYHPNRSAVHFFRAEVWPSLRARWPKLVWRLVGKNPEAIRALVDGDERIQTVGAVEDAVCELARAGIAVVPLLAGSGTRFKILEAWAAALPVVSTTIGAEGLPVRDGHSGLVADTARAFADAVSRLVACEELRRNLGTAGRLLLEQEFTWEKAWRNLNF